jgi:hypothetical protein
MSIIKVIQQIMFWAPTETTNILSGRNIEFFNVKSDGIYDYHCILKR